MSVSKNQNQDLQQWLNIKGDEQETKLFLTEAEVRSFPKFKNATDEEVRNIISTLHDLALISYEVFCKEEKAIKANQNDMKEAK